MERRNRKRKNLRRIRLKRLAVALSAVLVILLTVAATLEDRNIRGEQPPALNNPSIPQTESQDTRLPTEPPTEPPVHKIATATIASTGDLLLHQRVIDSGYDKETKTYNYDSIFNYFAEYVKKADYSVANMEGSLSGTDNGYKLSGYPRFNSPDEIVDAAKNAGFDMLLTANNHTYDTKTTGFHRTQEVIAQRQLDYIGTRPNQEAKPYIVKDINGIKVGMVCYTYETQRQSNGNKSLNGISLNTTDSKLLSSFNYDYLNQFYEQLAEELEAMRAEGAECTVVYIHWGSEYKTTPNARQEKISQQLCNLGVDIIVGGHAHVVQPIRVLQSENDPNKNTLCLYSMGNAVSNIRLSSTRPAHTEDGMLFSFTLAKYSDGSVVIESCDVLSTWVNRHKKASIGNKEVFEIVPLDESVEDWRTAFELDDSTFKQAKDSLERSKKVLQEGLDAANAFYSQQQAAHEIAIGVVK